MNIISYPYINSLKENSRIIHRPNIKRNVLNKIGFHNETKSLRHKVHSASKDKKYQIENESSRFTKKSRMSSKEKSQQGNDKEQKQSPSKMYISPESELYQKNTISESLKQNNQINVSPQKCSFNFDHSNLGESQISSTKKAFQETQNTRCSFKHKIELHKKSLQEKSLNYLTRNQYNASIQNSRENIKSLLSDKRINNINSVLDINNELQFKKNNLTVNSKYFNLDKTNKNAMNNGLIFRDLNGSTRYLNRKEKFIDLNNKFSMGESFNKRSQRKALTSKTNQSFDYFSKFIRSPVKPNLGYSIPKSYKMNNCSDHSADLLSQEDHIRPISCTKIRNCEKNSQYKKNKRVTRSNENSGIFSKKELFDNKFYKRNSSHRFRNLNSKNDEFYSDFSMSVEHQCKQNLDSVNKSLHKSKILHKSYETNGMPNIFKNKFSKRNITTNANAIRSNDYTIDFEINHRLRTNRSTQYMFNDKSQFSNDISKYSHIDPEDKTLSLNKMFIEKTQPKFFQDKIFDNAPKKISNETHFINTETFYTNPKPKSINMIKTKIFDSSDRNQLNSTNELTAPDYTKKLSQFLARSSKIDNDINNTTLHDMPRAKKSALLAIKFNYNNAEGKTFQGKYYDKYVKENISMINFDSSDYSEIDIEKFRLNDSALDLNSDASFYRFARSIEPNLEQEQDYNINSLPKENLRNSNIQCCLNTSKEVRKLRHNLKLVLHSDY